MSLTDDQKIEHHRRFAEATNQGRADLTMAMCVPGATVWHNFDDKTIEYASTGKTLEWMHTKIDGLRWETRSFSTTTDGWLWQAAIRGLAPGGELCAHTCMVVHLDERGLITHLEEYIDPAQMAPLRA
jgi:hypothetical protein